MPLLFHPRCDGRDVPDRAAAPAPGWRLASRRPLARLGALLAASLLIGACAQTRPGAEAAPAGPAVGAPVPAAQANAVAQRIGWGLNPSQAAQVARLGLPRYLQQQLDPGRDAALPRCRPRWRRRLPPWTFLNTTVPTWPGKWPNAASRPTA
jgi:hypothetical protein